MGERVIRGRRSVLRMASPDGSGLYPSKLMYVYPPVTELYVIGDAGFLGEPSVALLGPRRACRESLDAAREIAGMAVARGLAVVSGASPGIDAAALSQAVSCGGRAVAVLAGGLDDPRPRENAGLFQAVVDSGGAVVSGQEWASRLHPAAHECARRVAVGLADVTVAVDVDDLSSPPAAADASASMYRPTYLVPNARAVQAAASGLTAPAWAGVVSGADGLARALDGLPYAGIGPAPLMRAV